MEAIKKYAVLGLLAALFVGEVAAMRMSPQQAERARAAMVKQVALKQGVQPSVGVQSTKTDAETIQELEEAFMSDADVVAQKTKMLKPGEYFVHARGTADGVVVKKDVLEKSKTLAVMLRGIKWLQDNATISLPFSADVIKEVFASLDSPNALNTLKESLRQLSLDKLVDDANNVYALVNYLNISDVMVVYSDAIINKMADIAKMYQKIVETDFYNFCNEQNNLKFSAQYPDYKGLGNLNSQLGVEIMDKVLMEKGKLFPTLNFKFPGKEKPYSFNFLSYYDNKSPLDCLNKLDKLVKVMISNFEKNRTVL